MKNFRILSVMLAAAMVTVACNKDNLTPAPSHLKTSLTWTLLKLLGSLPENRRLKSSGTRC